MGGEVQMTLNINFDELLEEALEVNRQYNNYRLLREQHRERVIDLLDNMKDGEPARELGKILMITSSREE